MVAEYEKGGAPITNGTVGRITRISRRSTNTIRVFGISWVLVGGIAIAFLTVFVRRKLYDACALPLDVGSPGPGEGGFVLIFVIPPALVGTWVLMGATYALMTVRPTRAMYAAPLVSLIPSVLVLWAMLALTNIDPIGNVCPTGYPDWWTTWIPL